MNHIKHGILLFIVLFLSGCAQWAKSAPTVPPATFTSEEIIAYTLDLAVQQGLAKTTDYVAADVISVQLPNGDHGVFGTIDGYPSLPLLHGFQFLYRIREGELETMFLSPSGPFWGTRHLQYSKNESAARTQIEFLDLLNDEEGRLRQVLRVPGVVHNGSGLFDDIFEIIEITDSGFKIIFYGVDGSIIIGYDFITEDRYTHQYRDLNGDGNKEIIVDGENCKYRMDPKSLEKIETLGCTKSHVVYEYDGKEFVRQPDVVSTAPEMRPPNNGVQSTRPAAKVEQ